MTFVCQSCREPQKWHGNKVAKRIEYRCLNGNERIAGHTVGYFCRECAHKDCDKEKGLTPSLQGSLL